MNCKDTITRSLLPIAYWSVHSIVWSEYLLAVGNRLNGWLCNQLSSLLWLFKSLITSTAVSSSFLCLLDWFRVACVGLLSQDYVTFKSFTFASHYISLMYVDVFCSHVHTVHFLCLDMSLGTTNVWMQATQHVITQTFRPMFQLRLRVRFSAESPAERPPSIPALNL